MADQPPAVVIVEPPSPEEEKWQTLQAELSALRTRLAELESRPSVDQTKLTELNAEIAALRGRLEATEAQALATQEETRAASLAARRAAEEEDGRRAALPAPDPITPPDKPLPELSPGSFLHHSRKANRF